MSDLRKKVTWLSGESQFFFLINKDEEEDAHRVKLRIRQFLQTTRVRRSSRTEWNSGWQSSPYTESMSGGGREGRTEGEKERDREGHTRRRQTRERQ